MSGARLHLATGTNEIVIDLGELWLTRGEYIFSVAAYDPSRKISYFHAPEHKVLCVDGQMVTTAFLQMGAMPSREPELIARKYPGSISGGAANKQGNLTC